jgi:hypothetical protein
MIQVHLATRFHIPKRVYKQPNPTQLWVTFYRNYSMSCIYKNICISRSQTFTLPSKWVYLTMLHNASDCICGLLQRVFGSRKEHGWHFRHSVTLLEHYRDGYSCDKNLLVTDMSRLLQTASCIINVISRPHSVYFKCLNMFPSFKFDSVCSRTYTQIKNGVFWDVMPCGSCKNWRFVRTLPLLHQGDKNRWTMNNTSCN